MKKILSVIMLIVLMFLSANVVCAADTLINKGGEKQLVDIFYRTLNEHPVEFEATILQVIIEDFKTGRVSQAAVGVGWLTIFEAYYDDKRSCAKTREEVEEITKMKTALRIGTGGQAAINFLQTLNPGSSGKTQKEVTQMRDDYFNRSLPLMKKLYLSNQSRKHCN